MTILRGLLAASVVPMILACGGVLGDKGGDSGPFLDSNSTGGGGGGGNALPVTATCQEYLDCVASVDAATLGSLIGSYGEGGSCWTSGQAAADACNTACQTGLDQLGQQYPFAEACVDEILICEQIAGDWDLLWSYEGQGNCELPFDEIESPGEAECVDQAAGTLVAFWYQFFPTEFECSTAGGSLICVTEFSGTTITMDGAVRSDLSGADGRWNLSSEECTSIGDFTINF